jgi:hypothetical protein
VQGVTAKGRKEREGPGVVYVSPHRREISPRVRSAHLVEMTRLLYHDRRRIYFLAMPGWELRRQGVVSNSEILVVVF